MERREFVSLLGGAAAWPFAAHAQSPKVPVIGLLSPFSRADTKQWHQAFRKELRELGWVDGTNVRFEYRYADGRPDRLPELAVELVNLKVDVIVVAVVTDALAAAKATKTIPIVMAATGDPVASGLIASLARPGGNITGLSQMATDLAGKRLELLKEVAPGISRVAVLWNPQDMTSILTWREIQLPARQLGIELLSLEVRGSKELEDAFETAVNAKVGAITAMPAPVFVENEKRVADFAIANHLPSLFHLPEFVRVGGLLSYGPDRSDLFRRAATYVDKILKGANPSDLPVEQPTKFELLINLKTAKVLGLSIPPALLAIADEIIE
jgi:putative ABC transport system substrate-binding protein